MIDRQTLADPMSPEIMVAHHLQHVAAADGSYKNEIAILIRNAKISWSVSETTTIACGEDEFSHESPILTGSVESNGMTYIQVFKNFDTQITESLISNLSPQMSKDTIPRNIIVVCRHHDNKPSNITAIYGFDIVYDIEYPETATIKVSSEEELQIVLDRLNEV